MVDFAKHLKARLNQATHAAAPSMDPEPKKARKVKEPEVFPEPEDVLTNPVQAFIARRLMIRLASLNKQIATLKAEKDPLAEQLKGIVGPLGKLKMQADDIKVNHYMIPRKTIVGTLLLNSGVTPKVIAACTRTSESWAVRVWRVGEDEPGDDE